MTIGHSTSFAVPQKLKTLTYRGHRIVSSTFSHKTVRYKSSEEKNEFFASPLLSLNKVFFFDEKNRRREEEEDDDDEGEKTRK